MAIIGHGKSLGIGIAGATRVWDHDQYYSDDLLGEIERLLKRQGLEPSQIGGVVVYTGPGSFTGLRVAVTVANGIGFALGVGVTGVTEYALVKKDWPEVDWVILPSSADEVLVGSAAGFTPCGYTVLPKVLKSGSRVFVSNPELLAAIHPYLRKVGTVRIGNYDIQQRLEKLTTFKTPKKYRQVEPEYGRKPNITISSKIRPKTAG